MSVVSPSPASNRASGITLVLMVLGLFVILPFAITDPMGMRGVVAFSFGMLLLGLLLQQPRVGVPAILVYLAFTGEIRREMIPFLGWADLEPVLLVGPAVSMLVFGHIIVMKRFKPDSRLSRLMSILLIFMVLEIVNPLQGGITVGLAGAIFYIVPVLWFFIGRTMGNENILKNLYGAACIVAILSALWGFKQSLFGYADHELMWVHLAQMKNGAMANMLFIGHNHLRPIAFFSGLQEYGFFLMIGAVLFWARFLKGEKLSLFFALGLLAAIFLTGSRGPVVSTLAAFTLMWAVQGKSVQAWIPRAALAAILAVLGLVLTLTNVGKITTNETVQTAIDRQSQMLLNPLDQNKSSAGIHSGAFFFGIVEGFTHPLGLGLGSTTIAATKFGGNGTNTENDVSNLFVSLGFLGGFIYIGFIFYAFRTAFQYWIETRTRNALTIIGLILVTLGQWLAGDFFSVVMIICFSLGTLDRMNTHLQRAKQKRLEEALLAEDALVWKSPRGSF